MPIPVNITDLSPVAASNSPAGSESPIYGNDYLQALSAFIRQNYDTLTAQATSIASKVATSDLASTATAAPGASLVGFLAAGAGAVGRTQLSKERDVVGVLDFGAGVAGLPVSMALGGGSYLVPAGTYVYTTPLVADYSNVAFPDYMTPSTRVSLKGDALHSTFLTYNGTAGTYGLVLTGPASIANLGVYQQSQYSDFVMQDSGHTRTRNGISITNESTAEFRRLNVSYFGIGTYVNSSLSCKFDNVVWTYNATGTVFDSTTLQALPNAHSFDNCEWNANTTAAATAAIIGATNRFASCRIEQNGTTSGAAGEGGFLFGINPTNGPASLTFDTCYFEGNGGQADLYLTNTGTQEVTVVIKGCTFNRTSSAKYVTNNIVGANSSTGTLTIVLIGCSFFSTGTYVASAARAFFLAADTKVQFIDGGGNTFSENTSRVVGFGASPATYGRVTGSTGAALSVPPHITTSRSGTGTYTITSQIPFAKSSADYAAMFSFINGGVNAQAKWTNTSATVCDVVIYNVLTGAAVDCDFAFSIAGIK